MSYTAEECAQALIDAKVALSFNSTVTRLTRTLEQLEYTATLHSLKKMRVSISGKLEIMRHSFNPRKVYSVKEMQDALPTLNAWTTTYNELTLYLEKRFPNICE